MEMAQQGDGIPDCFAEENDGSGSDGHADEGVERHGGGKTKGLTDDLRALGFGVAREVRNIECDSGPETDHAGERRDEEANKFRGGVKFAGRVKNRAHTAGLARDPEKKKQADEEHEGRADAFEELDGFNAAPDDEHVDGPKKEEAEPGAAGKICGGGPNDAEHGVNGLAADPGLNAEPAASDQGSKNRGNVCAANAEGGAHENGEGDSVFGASVGVEEHGNQDNEIAEKNGEDGLHPVHATGDEAGSKHVGGNANAHGHPERGVIVSAPGALLHGNGSEIGIVERWVSVCERHVLAGK